MRILITVSLAGLFIGCETAPVTAAHKPFPARVTYYKKGEDKYGSRIAIGGRAKEGVTCAAERGFQFGRRLFIPALRGILGTGNFEVQDRGRAVQSRKASRGKLPVIDIYVASRQKYNWIINHIKPILEVNPL